MDAAHFEKTLTSEVLFEGRVVTLTKDTALLENGKTATREVVHHHGGACIVPYFEDGTICMVRQFRYAMQQDWSNSFSSSGVFTLHTTASSRDVPSREMACPPTDWNSCPTRCSPTA